MNDRSTGTRPADAAVRIVSRTVITWLIGVTVLLVIAGTAAQLIRYNTSHDTLYGLIPLFDLGMEANIPTYFSSFILLTSALLLAVISVGESKSGSAFTKQWVVLAVGFFYLSLDESARIHELMIRPMRDLLGNYSQGVLYFAWVVPGMAIVLGLAVFFLKFLRSLDSVTMKYFVIGGIVYVGGAIGMEMVDGFVAARLGVDTLVYNLLIVVEEAGEMSGVLIFIAGLLRYLKNYSPRPVIEVS